MKKQPGSIVKTEKIKPTLFVTLFLLIANFSFAQNNLIGNGGFEDNTNGWTVWGATLGTTNDAHSGNSAALVTNRNNPWDALVKDITGLLVSGNTYDLSAWVKIPDPAVNFRITIQLNVDGISTYHGFCRTENPAIGVYTQYKSEVKLEWTGNLTGANMYFETESVDGVYSDYLVDDVSFVENNPPEDIIQDGKGWKDIKSTMLMGGCNTEGNKNYFNNEAAKAQVLKDCNTVNIQAYPAWGRWDEQKRHVYHVDEFSNQVKEMKNQNMTVTMHMLLGWDQYFPDWYKKGDFPADTLEAMMESWLNGIISYEGNDTLVDIWNVVNEAISWDGKGGYWPLYNSNFNNACELQRMGFEPDASGLTGTEFVNAEHPVYIRKAFEFARTLTNKKLELRDSGFEFPGSSKYNAFYQLAVHLKKMNVPVDVIGFQTHLNINENYDWEGYTSNIKRYIDLGYEVNLTEVDIGDVDKQWNEEKAEKQKLLYYQLITAAIRGGANDFQTWGFIDASNDGWRSGEKALPYTNNFAPKQAYYGIMEALTDMSSILFWEMDTTENNIMPDVMSYNNFGTLHNFNSPEIVPGYIGNALQFDGADDFISNDNISDSISGDFTFSCYIKTAATKKSIIADFISSDNSVLQLGINDEGKIFVSTPNNEFNDELVGLIPVNDDEWHFVAIQNDSTKFRLYIDDSSPTAQVKGTNKSISKLIVGTSADETMAFNGAIDEVKLYDSVIEENSFVRSFAPLPPQNLDYTLREMKIRLSWTDQSTNEKGFIIERKINNGSWEEAGRVNANTLYFIEEMELYEKEYSYRVRSFTSAGKSNESNSISVLTPEDPTTGITEFSNIKKINIFPNPTFGNFTVLSNNVAEISLLDIQGRIIVKRKNCTSSESFNISGMTDGIYFIKASGDSGTSTVKLIKK